MPQITGKIVNTNLDTGAIDDVEVIGGYKVVQTLNDLFALRNIHLYGVAKPTSYDIAAALGKQILTNGSPVYVEVEKTTYRWNNSQKAFIADVSSGDPGGSGGTVAIEIDSELSTDSENPIQNKAVTNALNGKVDKVYGKGLSTYDYTKEDRDRVNKILTSGNGTSFLSSDGTYKSFNTKIGELKFTDDGDGNVEITAVGGTLSFSGNGHVILEVV